MTLLLALRHAPTAWNAEGRFQGRSDQPLSAEGLALAAGWRLPDQARDWPVLTSPLLRARQTALAMGLAATPDPALIEMDWGAWEGRTYEELAGEDATGLVANEARGLDFMPPDGESPRQVMERLTPWLAAAGRGPRVLVTHKGVLRALLALATGWNFQGKPPAKIRSGRALLFGLAPDGGLALLDSQVMLAP